MRLFLKRIGFILLIFISAALIISAGSLWSLRQSSFYKPSFLVNDIKEKEFDYIVIGSSTGLTTLNTKVIDSVLEINGLNLSMDDTSLSSQYLMLQHFLAQGKTAKFCVLSPSIKDYDVKNNPLSGNDYRFLPYVNNTYVSEYYNQFPGKPAKLLSLSKWFPILGVSYYNAEVFYPSLQSLLLPKKRVRFDAKGNYVYPSTKKKNDLITNFQTINLEFENPYLKKIKALCKQKNIQLICYLTPIAAKKVVYSSKEFKVINHSDLLKDRIYFFDNLHVDGRGRQISSEKFAEKFKEFQ